MKKYTLLLLLTLLIASCGQGSSKKGNTETQTNIKLTDTISEIQKFKMFCAALKNHSTAPNYVVVKVKNLNTGEIKEICTEAPFVEGAISRQIGKFSFPTDCNDYPNRYFEFSADSALWNISFDLYTISELEEYAETIDIGKIVQQIKDGILQEKTFGINKRQTWQATRREQTMFAHIMFNNGVMMTRGCFAGNVCELYIYDEPDSQNQFSILDEE